MKNSVESIIREVLSNDEYLKSDKRVFRLVMSHLSEGVITIYGEEHIGKKLFVINLINNLIKFNNAEVLFVTDVHEKEETAIRFATNIAGNDPFTISRINGIDKCINNSICLGEKITISDYLVGNFVKIFAFIKHSPTKHKIVVLDKPSMTDLKKIDELAKSNNIIIINIVNFPFDRLRGTGQIIRALNEKSDVMVFLEHSFSTYENQIKVNILRNKVKQHESIVLKINQEKQRAYELFENNDNWDYPEDEDFPF